MPTTMRNVLAALVAVLALIAPAASDETQSCSAGAHPVSYTHLRAHET